MIARALARELDATLGRVARWRADADIIRALGAQSQSGEQVSFERLQQVEETASEVYREIQSFDAIAAAYQDGDPLILDRLGEVGDALRLVLLEITELGTSLYALRSKH